MGVSIQAVARVGVACGGLSAKCRKYCDEQKTSSGTTSVLESAENHFTRYRTYTMATHPPPGSQRKCSTGHNQSY